MSSENSDLITAAAEILNVSSELTRLRGAVDAHSRAAEALSETSAQLKHLAETLDTLPNGFATQFERGSQVVEAIEKALAPAGEMRSSIAQVHNKFSELATSQVVVDGVAHLDRGIATGAQSLNESFERSLSSSSILAVAALNEFQASMGEWQHQVRSQAESMEARLQTVEEGIGALESKLVSFGENLDGHVGRSADANEQVKYQLATLERLAKRSLIAILMGKDAPGK